MNYIGGGSGCAQNLQFNQCELYNFHTILNAQSDTLTSEVAFVETRIIGCGTIENPCEIFIINNDQSVN